MKLYASSMRGIMITFLYTNCNKQILGLCDTLSSDPASLFLFLFLIVNVLMGVLV